MAYCAICLYLIQLNRYTMHILLQEIKVNTMTLVCRRHMDTYRLLQWPNVLTQMIEVAIKTMNWFCRVSPVHIICMSIDNNCTTNGCHFVRNVNDFLDGKYTFVNWYINHFECGNAFLLQSAEHRISQAIQMCSISHYILALILPHHPHTKKDIVCV
jgi:hypothetical protein